MRPIKFRGKAELGGKWYVGDFITDIQELNRTCDQAFISPHWDKLNIPIRVIPETVSQYTGLKDQLGKQIYEGDIVSYTDGHDGFTAVVERDYWQWYLKGLDVLDNFDFADYTDRDQTDLLIIGNKHEEPELLEGETSD